MRRGTLAVAAGLIAAPSVQGFEPTANYIRRELAGFPVLVHPKVERNAVDAADGMAELVRQLTHVVALLPEDKLPAVRKTRIWVEWEAGPGADPNWLAYAFGSRDWLTANGYNPAKVNGIEVPNIRRFANASKQGFGGLMMHELAHVYHYKALGPDHPGVRAAFRQAVDRKLYDRVADTFGRTGRAYARADRFEYFAELTETYFGRNDYFPFDRRELEQHDPVGYRLMRDVWGDPRWQAARAAARPARSITSPPSAAGPEGSASGRWR
jgi:hypothetical protein